ncbi:cytochrome c peroxidase [Halothiobacillus sp. 15-55-196]|uniref:cytochrome-c peroxidase n=1 Tax=Halothiobacillus sp. 15-55-196 TaxID=1970382 RepID=UPI0025B9D7B7|nr:cytochrome c peroxidase [Halothiobacillus sp. 15-55-196]
MNRSTITWMSLVVIALSGCLLACNSNSNDTSPRADASVQTDQQYELATGKNPHPVKLVIPKVKPLSAMAELGKSIFYDKSLSGSGQISCATCHDPHNAYGPPGDLPVMLGGPHLNSQGARAVPSLMYLYRQPAFSIGPDPSGDSDNAPNLNQIANHANQALRHDKTASQPNAAALNMVPQGGLFLDGRVDTLQQQAYGPLLNPVEMDGGSVQIVAAKLKNAPYTQDFVDLFGNQIENNPNMQVSEAMFAVARYQVEDPSFHPYSSKFDAWLEGKATFTPAQMRGYLLFNDPKKGNCAACHLDQPSKTGLPPLLTDHQFEALGVPRNTAIAANKNPDYFDLGICGPFRKDLAKQTQYCGMFLTPTLRNVATRKVFFHNGYYHNLDDVLKFYDYRDTNPERIYPTTTDGKVEKYNDIPTAYQANVDMVDAPFNRKRGQQPALTENEMQYIVAFLKTLTDGYRQ